nr:hypothetical protein [Tanacetum cinerariifolium]
PRDVGKEGDDVGGGQPGGHLLVGGGDAERADRGGVMPRHPPQLPGHLDGGGLAVGPGHGDGDRREWREEGCGELCELLARIVGGDRHRPLDRDARPGHHRDRAGAHRLGDIVLAIHPRAVEGA